MPSVDLSKEPEFMAFKKFHLNICDQWNTIIDEVMKNDCVDPSTPCPSKQQYVTKLQIEYNKVVSVPTCFIQCDPPWDETSSLATLLAAIPKNVNCYKGTLGFIINKSTTILQQVSDSMAQIPTSGFADYQASILCKTDSSNNTICTDEKGAIFLPEKAPAPSSGSGSGSADQQALATNDIISRCRTINMEIPELKALLAKAKEQVDQLKTVKQKAQDGTLLPAPAKSA
jgi:hypothetical protein